MKKTIASALTLGLLLSALAGCGTPSGTGNEDTAATAGTADGTVTEAPAEGTAQVNYKIGACPAASDIAFFQRLAAGFQDAGAALGVTVDVQYTDRSIEKELELTDTFIAQGYDGIILETVDSAAITGCLQRAASADVAMIAVDTVPDRTELATGTVTSDNYGGGYAAGELMMQLLPEGGQIIMTKFQYSSVAMDDRYRGFEDAIAGSNLEMVEYVEQDGTREDTMQKIASLLSKYPDLVGVFCSQGDPAMGVLSAVEGAGLSDKITILSYDIEDEVAAAIKQGSAIKGGVTQFPYEMGRRSVVELVNALNGQAIDEVIAIPVLAVTQDNIDELLLDTTAFLEKYSDYVVQ